MHEKEGKITRRAMLRVMGTGGVIGLTGCSSTQGNGDGGQSTEAPASTATAVESTATPEGRKVQEIPIEEFAALWLEETPETNTSVSTFSPAQLRSQFSLTLTENTYGLIAYDDLPYAPKEVPLTFIQTIEAPLSTVKVDQLPASVTSEDVTSLLMEKGYEHVQDLSGYSIHRTPASDAVYGVGSARVVIGVNYNSPANTARNSQHQNDIESLIDEQSESESGFTTSMNDAIADLDIHDSLGIWQYASDDADLVHGLDPQYQPNVGATSVDFDANVQYGAWAFEDQNLAEWVYADLKEGGSFYEWERINQTDNVITAAGEAQVEKSVNEPASMNLAFPKI